jgi:hypothetical protein
MHELKEIPTHHLPEAFQEAKAQAGAFLATNGLIIKCYRDARETRFEDAQKHLRAQGTAMYLNAPPRKEIENGFDKEAFFKKIFESLK